MPLACVRQVDRLRGMVKRGLEQMRCPTLVMHGAADPWLPPACGQDTVRRIPGAQWALIADMAHDLVPCGHPEIVRRVLAALRPFLQTVRTTAA